MITVNIVRDHEIISDSVCQYDFGQKLRMYGALPSPLEVHFSLNKTGGEANRRIGTLVHGAIEVDVPDKMLENDGKIGDYFIYAFLYVHEETSGETIYRVSIPVKARPRPGNFIPPDQPDFPEQLIGTVVAERKKAEDQAKEAEAWAHGRTDHPDRENDNAKYYAEKAKESMEQTGTDRTEVERMKQSVELSHMQVEDNLRQTEELKNQAQTSAENAALSERNAKESENAAEESRVGAENAEEVARQYAAESLEQKNAVDQKVSEFETLRDSAVKSVNEAGSAQKKAVEDAGTSAVNNISKAGSDTVKAVNTAATNGINSVNTAGDENVGAVNRAGTAQVKSIEKSGTKQVQAVEEEGTKQKQSIELYAQEVKDFREQVISNTKSLGGFSFALNPDDNGLDITYTE